MFKKQGKSNLSRGDLIYLQNAAKTLAANIRFSSIDTPLRVVGVTSTVPNEGKTTISYMLGQAMASSGMNVLLINCDFRHRTLATRAKVQPKHGIYGVLTGQCQLSDAVVALDIPRLHLLDVEPGIPNPVDILSSQRFHDLMQSLRSEYGFIVVDTPPLSAFVDAAVVSQNADGMLLVVRDGYTKREELLDAYGQLCKAGANVIGSVLNYCSEERSGRSYYEHYNHADSKMFRRNISAEQPKQEFQKVPASYWDANAAGKTGASAPVQAQAVASRPSATGPMPVAAQQPSATGSMPAAAPAEAQQAAVSNGYVSIGGKKRSNRRAGQDGNPSSGK